MSERATQVLNTAMTIRRMDDEQLRHLALNLGPDELKRYIAAAREAGLSPSGMMYWEVDMDRRIPFETAEGEILLYDPTCKEEESE